MAYKRKTYKRRVVRRRAPLRRRAPARRPAFAGRATPLMRVMRRMIGRNVENKTRQWGSLGTTLIPSNDAAAADLNNIVQLGFRAGGAELTQGTGNGSRIGNKVRVKRMTFKGTLVCYPYNASTHPVPQPLQVKMFIFYPRQNAGLVPAPFTAANFFDFNNGVNGFRNDLVDMWATPNSELYTVVATRTFKLGLATSVMYPSGTNGPNNFSNNDFKLNCNFSVNYTKYLPKNVVYNDNTIDSTSRSLYALFCLCNADGTAITNTVRPCGMQYQCDAVYEDA